MTLRKRLIRLEAQRRIVQESPRVIMFTICWRGDNGMLQSIADHAQVMTASGWQSIHRRPDEPEAEFELRADAMAGDFRASGEWAMA